MCKIVCVNPRDEWKKFKPFDDEDKAKQSFDILKKHRNNLFKGSQYMMYRLYDSVKDIYYI